MSRISQETARAAALLTLGKVADKESARDKLCGGAAHEVALKISGFVDGVPCDTEIAAALTINHDATSNSSSGPPLPNLVAYLLSKLNKASRGKVLRELPEAFIAAGEKLPEVAADDVDAAESLLKRLRAKTVRETRGSVACRYEIKG